MGSLDGDALLAPLVLGLLRDGISVCLEVDGHSMTPFIRRRDRVTVEPRRNRRPSIGQVLLVGDGAHSFTVHRHVGWSAGRIVRRGDSTLAADTAIPVESVLGVVTQVTRQGRRVWAALGPERRLIAWLSRIGLLGQLARLRARHKQRASPCHPAVLI